MFETKKPYAINLSEWVEKAKSNPSKYHVRQVTEILMHAVGATKNLQGNMYLKGGTLMAIAHNSERMTADIDYSWLGEPFHPSIADEIKDSLDVALKQAIAKLGYLDLACRIQSVKKEPRGWKEVSYPALSIGIGYAAVGSPQEKSLHAGNCSQVMRLDISFNEPLESVERLVLDDTGISINAYAPTEIIAEKMRALLQQVQRTHDHYRRQDIYDITLLLRKFAFDQKEKKVILETLHIKANARSVLIQKDSFADKAVKAAAKKLWDTIIVEIEAPLPSFDECYAEVQAFYESLPW